MTTQLTLLDGKKVVTTAVYAKCDAGERTSLWNDIYSISQDMAMPWLIGGDFSVILHEEEKIGGLPVYPQEYEDFAFCVNSCELFDIKFKGSPFTRWNGRAAEDCIFKRLDRVLMNQMWLGWWLNVEVEHLARTGSDHAPLLLTCGGQVSIISRPFKFLKFWTEHADFKGFVE